MKSAVWERSNDHGRRCIADCLDRKCARPHILNITTISRFACRLFELLNSHRYERQEKQGGLCIPPAVEATQLGGVACVMCEVCAGEWFVYLYVFVVLVC